MLEVKNEINGGRTKEEEGRRKEGEGFGKAGGVR